MNEEDIKNLKDLRFNITEDMKKIFLDMLIVQQILEDTNLSNKETKLLIKHKEKLFKQFTKDFQAHNPVEVAIVRAYLSSKKNSEK